MIAAVHLTPVHRENDVALHKREIFNGATPVTSTPRSVPKSRPTLAVIVANIRPDSGVLAAPGTTDIDGAD
jgi:hypothetical protein